MGPRANIARTMRLLVTGGAGFIGSNFARYWVEQHPEDHVVVYDVLTYAGNRPNLADIEDRIVFVQGDICDPAAAEKTLRGEEIDTDRPLRRRVAQLPGRARTRACSSAPTCSGPRPCSRRPARSASPGSTTSRRARSTGTCPSTPTRSFTEESPVPAPHALQRLEGRRATTRCGPTPRPTSCPITITNCANNYGPYQFPEKLIPHFCALALDDQPLTLYASTREPPRVAARARPLHRHRRRARARAGSARRTTSAAGSRRPSWRSPTGSSPRWASRSRSRRSCPTGPATTAATCSTPPSCARELGWAPSIEWEQGLADTVAWYADHRDWWEPLRARAPVAEGAWGTGGG